MITYELNDGVAVITMDDGKLNVMSLAMLQALHTAFDRAAADEAIVVLRSGREVFSAGFDLKVFAANDAEGSHAMVLSGAELALKVLSHPYPVVSVWAGHAYPMGAFLILSSDVRLGVEGPGRIGLNEVAIGIPVPSFALEVARQRVAPAYLNRGTLTGEMLGATDALAAGFVDRLVPADEAPAALAAIIDGLKKIHLPSHATTKARLRAAAIAAVRAAIAAELTAEAYQRNAARGSTVRLPKVG